jgi:alpha-tubulin suppressor-like RCC1 family protein
VSVLLPEAAVDISAGSWHTCAVTKRQDIYCWGDNSAGELGNGTFTNSTKPVRVVLP